MRYAHKKSIQSYDFWRRLSIYRSVQHYPAGKTEHHFQLSLDFMNIGNMINSKWGVIKNASSSNGCRILKYEGMDDNKTPIFSMYKINGEYPTETYSYNRIYTECWKMQVGIRYIFN
ncbi:hypothetical protein [Parabacteroides sp. AF27-14]|uniref:hypothetical protein n=1 Tax=Parabacteroides sp. AF27-14 TaxID=2293116 RepID=UPI001F4390DC|nr:MULTISPECIES: hypothetical protein [Parabacteroides]